MTYRECGPGWNDLIDKLEADLREVYPDIVASQIKEKFGGLRYYIDSVPEEVSDRVFDLIETAEAASYAICEACGDVGTINEERWKEVRCEHHKPFRKVSTLERIDRYEKNVAGMCDTEDNDEDNAGI